MKHEINFDHPCVQLVYETLCQDHCPPKGEHWEGFVAQKIVEALAAMQPSKTNEQEAFEKVIESECGAGATMKWPHENSPTYANQRVQDYRTGWLWAVREIESKKISQRVFERLQGQ